MGRGSSKLSQEPPEISSEIFKSAFNRRLGELERNEQLGEQERDIYAIGFGPEDLQTFKLAYRKLKINELNSLVQNLKKDRSKYQNTVNFINDMSSEEMKTAFYLEFKESAVPVTKLLIGTFQTIPALKSVAYSDIRNVIEMRELKDYMRLSDIRPTAEDVGS